jgi:hypothetical protein
MKIGIIAEDDSDVAVVREVTLTLLRPYRIGFRRFVGGGCGKLRRKCTAWATNLVQQGCPWIVVVHDLDVHDEAELRAVLRDAIAPAHAQASVVLIPRREIEAWLLYDGAAVAAAFRERRPPRLPGDPESLADPKRFLRDLVWARFRKDYLNTVHNSEIAKHVDVARLRRARSFAPHFDFTARVRDMVRHAGRTRR